MAAEINVSLPCWNTVRQKGYGEVTFPNRVENTGDFSGPGQWWLDRENKRVIVSTALNNDTSQASAPTAAVVSSSSLSMLFVLQLRICVPTLHCTCIAVCRLMCLCLCPVVCAQASVQTILLNISGTHDVAWTNVSFAHTTWNQPNLPQGYVKSFIRPTAEIQTKHDELELSTVLMDQKHIIFCAYPWMCVCVCVCMSMDVCVGVCVCLLPHPHGSYVERYGNVYFSNSSKNYLLSPPGAVMIGDGAHNVEIVGCTFEKLGSCVGCVRRKQKMVATVVRSRVCSRSWDGYFFYSTYE